MSKLEQAQRELLKSAREYASAAMGIHAGSVGWEEAYMLSLSYLNKLARAAIAFESAEYNEAHKDDVD